MSAIVIENLSKHYGKRAAVRGINLRVPQGALFGFLGPNGAGKTTTIRVLLGFLKASQGTATIFGQDCWRNSPRIKADVGYLPGDLRLYPWITGLDALELFGATRRIDVRKSGRALADRFGLDMQVRVENMSRGMRQKLGLILVLAHRPRVLILDEPTASLDPLMQDRLYECLREAAAEGRTVFFSSHTLSEVEALCDRVAILREGELVADETLVTLRQRAGREVVIRWSEGSLGDAPLSIPEFLTVTHRDANLWHCTVEGSSIPLLRWLADKPVADAEIGHPDLESLFRRYYRTKDGDA